MTEADIAWAAGIFEGEGCFSTIRGNARPGNLKIRACLEMCDEDVVQRFFAVVGIGIVATRQRPHRKRQWRWHADGLDKVTYIGELFRPWLGERRLARYEEIVALRREYDERISAIRSASQIARRERERLARVVA